ncbi:beta family protein [Bradyrhizobium sp. USDA 3397]
MGEYQALSRLSDAAKDRVVPFIVIPEIEFDFDDWAPKKSMQEHLEPFPKRYKQKWGDRPAWIDVHPVVQTELMGDGSLPIAYVFEKLHQGNRAVPAISLDVPNSIATAVAGIVKRDRRGAAIRLRVENLMRRSARSDLASLMSRVGVSAKESDLIVDLGSPNYEPYDDFADALIAALDALGDLSAFRTYAILGCAYPETVPLDKPGGVLIRHDWQFFKTFIGKLRATDRVPNYGDYTIVNPQFTPKDMRLIKAGGKVVYTSNGEWFIRKGGSFRDNPSQMHDHCAFIVSSGRFRGASFSDGDNFIELCSRRAVGPSNQPFWKQVAINHHIMHVLEDLSI